MQWSRIQVEMPSSSAVSDARLGVGESGLDATAEQMHDDFIGSIPHLDEVREEHHAVISELSQAMEAARAVSRELQPLGELLSELGGSMGEPKTSEASDSDLTCLSGHWYGGFKGVSWCALAK